MDPGGHEATDAIDAGPSRMRTFAGNVLVEPDAVAIVDTDRDWSYADLDRTADAIGDTLRATGVRRGDVVAVVTPRTAPGIAGLLAVARSGGAHHVSRTGILVCVSGHGYLDLTAYSRMLDGGLADESVPHATLRATVAALHPVDAG